MQVVNKSISTAIETGENCTTALKNSIDAHNAATQRTTNVAPEVLLFGRSRRGALPTMGPTSEMVAEETLRKRDASEKRKTRERENEKRRARPSTIQPGDHVLLKRVQKAKDQTVFEPTQFEVLSGDKGDFLIRAPDGRQFKRNQTQLKKIRNPDAGPRAKTPRASEPMARQARRKQAPRHLSDYVLVVES
jgi:hypothetical protein